MLLLLQQLISQHAVSTCVVGSTGDQVEAVGPVQHLLQPDDVRVVLQGAHDAHLLQPTPAFTT